MDASIDFKYSDQNLRNQNTSYTLSILSHQDGFVFYIYSKHNNTLVHFEKKATGPTLLLSDYFKQQKALINEILNLYNIEEVRYLFPSNKVTVVPSTVYAASKQKLLYTFNLEPEHQFAVHSYLFNHFNCNVLFPVPEILVDFQNEFDVKFKFYNQLIPFLEFVSQQTVEARHEMFLNLSSDSMQIVVTENNRIKFLNTFHYQTNTDFLYYVLYVQKQLNISKRELNINVMGITSKNDEKLKSLPQFFEKVYYYKELKLKHNMAIKQEEIIRYLNFLNLHLCE